MDFLSPLLIDKDYNPEQMKSSVTVKQVSIENNQP